MLVLMGRLLKHALFRHLGDGFFLSAGSVTKILIFHPETCCYLSSVQHCPCLLTPLDAEPMLRLCAANPTHWVFLEQASLAVNPPSPLHFCMYLWSTYRPGLVLGPGGESREEAGGRSCLMD